MSGISREDLANLPESVTVQLEAEFQKFERETGKPLPKIRRKKNPKTISQEDVALLGEMAKKQIEEQLASAPEITSVQVEDNDDRVVVNKKTKKVKRVRNPRKKIEKKSFFEDVFKDTIFELALPKKKKKDDDNAIPMGDHARSFAADVVKGMILELLVKPPPPTPPKIAPEFEYEKEKAEIKASEDATNINRILDGLGNSNDLLQDMLNIQKEIVESIGKLSTHMTAAAPSSAKPPPETPPGQGEKQPRDAKGRYVSNKNKTKVKKQPSKPKEPQPRDELGRYTSKKKPDAVSEKKPGILGSIRSFFGKSPAATAMAMSGAVAGAAVVGTSGTDIPKSSAELEEPEVKKTDEGLKIQKFEAREIVFDAKNFSFNVKNAESADVTSARKQSDQGNALASSGVMSGNVGDVTESGPTGGDGPGGDVAPQVQLTDVKTSSGKSVQVAAQYATQFQGFINDLEKTGYKINDIGGYANRMNVNDPSKLSTHAFGAAIDINPAQNPNNSTTTDLPKETTALAAKWGLGWGMNWTSVKDPMHFSSDPSEGGGAPKSAPATPTTADGAKGQQNAQQTAPKTSAPTAAPQQPPTKGNVVAAASANYTTANRLPQTAVITVPGGSGRATGVPRSHRPSESYMINKNDPGNVEPLDARDRFRELFGIAA